MPEPIEDEIDENAMVDEIIRGGEEYLRQRAEGLAADAARVADDARSNGHKIE